MDVPDEAQLARLARIGGMDAARMALALHLDLATILEVIAIAQQPMRLLADLDPAGQPV